MNHPLIKKILPHIIAYLILMGASFLFFAPFVFQGKVLQQADITRALGMQGESTKIKEQTGEYPLWTNSMFGGMPAYQIHGANKGNYTRPFYQALLLWQGISDVPFVILMAMACCYFLLVVLGVDWRIGVIGAVTFGLSTYYIDLAEAGHASKMVAVALVPGVFAGAVLAYKRYYLLGGVIFGLFLAMQIFANHVQITYYAFWVLVILGIVQLIKAWRQNELPSFGKGTAALVVGGVLGIAANASQLWTTYEYSKETIRGKSELSSNAKKGDGLTKEYAWDWSYGITESMTLLIQNFNGGGASQKHSGTETHDRLYNGQVAQFTQQGYSRANARVTAEQQISSLFYWGDQPFLGVSIYLGAVICFLFFVGIWLVTGPLKWWLTAGAAFTLSLAWGGNFFLNEILFDYFPLFNKFRAVTMALGLTQLCASLLAALALQQLVSAEVNLALKRKALFIGAGITGGLCLVALMLSYGMDFSNPEKDQRLPANILEMLKEDRAALMRKDALRSLALIGLSAILIWAYLEAKVKSLLMVGGIGLLALFDIWTINRRIIYDEKYEEPEAKAASIAPLPADNEILQDPDPHFRVLDLSRGSPFTSWSASFFHKSLGGYHAAKLMRYQELIERYLSNPDQHRNILAMLNTKYLIQGQGPAARAVRIQGALGNAWFVKDYEIVPDGDAEIAGLDDLQPGQKALIQQAYAAPLEGLNIQPDSNATIKLTSYHPDRMLYDYKAASEQLAVFSEIYYPPEKGWKLLLDGDISIPIIKANYLLRAARLPAGNHTLEMRFEPRSFYLGETISKTGSILLLFALAAGIWFFIRTYGLPDPNQLDEIERKKPKRPTKTVVKKKVNPKGPKRRKT